MKVSDLDPELWRYFHGDGWLHHPLIAVPPGKMDAASINERYRKKKAWCAEAERAGDWWQYIALHEKAYRTKPLLKALRRISDPAMAASLVATVWSTSENVWQHRSEWIGIWARLPDPGLTMSDAERIALLAFPDRIPIFRGFRKYLKRGARSVMDCR
jgi:hypothetical protein